MYDYHRTVGLPNPPASLDAKRVESVLQTAWSGKNYSARIWSNRSKLTKEIQRSMMTAIHRGSSIQQLSKDLAQRMEVGYKNAERLIRTELNAVENKASADAMKDAEFTHYQFMATLDRRTCARCGEKDGEIFALKDMNQGENAPPLHPRCRCTICATFDTPASKGKKSGERFARETNRERIPADITYREWKAVYIDKSKTFDVWRAEKENDIISKIEPPLWTGKGYRILTYADKNIEACKTFEGLKTYWAENYNVAVQDVVKNLDFAAVKDAAIGIEAMLKEFPPAGRYLKELTVFESGIMTTTRFAGKINFNPVYFSDGEKVKNEIASGVARNFYPKNMTITGAGAHEMGHIIEDWLIEKYGGSAQDVNSRTFPRKWIIEAYAKATQFRSLEQLKKEIGEYATKNSSECLASAVSDYFTNGEQSKLLSRMIWQRLKEELN